MMSWPRRFAGALLQPKASSAAVALAAGVSSLFLLGASPQDVGSHPSAAPDAPAASIWTAPNVAELPPWARSARVRKQDQAIVGAPSARAPRRGSADLGAALPIFAVQQGDGCDGRWLQVGPSSWICEDTVDLSPGAPLGALTRTWPHAPDGLPFRYHFVGHEGTFAYARLDAADVDEPIEQLEPGFAVAIVEERLEGGSRYGRTRRGLWVPMRDLSPIHGFAFQGTEIAPDAVEMRFAWVVVDDARVHRRAGERSFQRTSDSHARFVRLMLGEQVDTVSGSFVRVSPAPESRPRPATAAQPEQWLSLRDLARPVVAPPPPEVDAEVGEHWIDVDLASQTVIAYEGRRPVFATLVSTGKGKKGSATATPPGTYRIWAKLLTSDMDNLEEESASRYYRMEDVPYVQYFTKGVGLHGAFWHRSFGRVRSHGCVNLSPLDAQRLFWWTTPRLPAGWTAALPSPHTPGSIVRVR
ncbi:L,D-transpeptidase [Chondromyces apiculatus]|uniref:L,D-TPase catalytic domain-containing protein n=1 Tax=Chondromyces apiculatus DSM 436 TaxID=1192034 RepID=A0A017TBJ9_9BACT|nr:L,D-transpeptidase [Chondromyces apiculatus]EYF06658.1 Hypothetical protein CAP_1788 [Chondromyces apiculatus DSM 436]